MHISLLTAFLLLPSSLALQCLHYRASMPFDDNEPFEATIEEAHALRPICWIKETYREHNMKQTVANLFVSPEEKRREEGGKGDYATWGFKRWDMQCLPGYQAWINVGLRTVQMIDSRALATGGRREQTGFITAVTEDFYASAFKFTKDHNCEPARTPAQIAAENKRVGDGIQQKLNEALRKIEADLIRNGGMSEVEKKRYDDAREVVRVALGGATGAGGGGGGGGGRKHVQLDRPGPQAQRQQVRVA